MSTNTTEVKKASEVFSLDVSLYVAHFVFLSTQLANSLPLFSISLPRFCWEKVFAELHHGGNFLIQLLHLELVALRVSRHLFKVEVVAIPFCFGLGIIFGQLLWLYI